MQNTDLCVEDVLSRSLFRDGLDDSGGPWPKEYDDWDEMEQWYYEWGRQTALLLPRTLINYNDHGRPDRKFVFGFLKLLKYGYIR